MITKEVCFTYETAGKRSVRWANMKDVAFTSNEGDPMPQLTVLAWDYKKLNYRRFAAHKMLDMKPLTLDIVKEEVYSLESLPKFKNCIVIFHRNLGSKDDFLFKKAQSTEERIDVDALLPIGYEAIGWMEASND